ncbi:MAG: DUF2971 domain-containing protein [Elusimicrobiaceae bacterium]|nr:DUF2971 domain-containing protein [Elusimicrobiaceae bacterium]
MNNYEKAIIALNETRSHFISTLSQIDYPLPSSFLLFRPVNIHTLHMLSNQALWFSHPSTFNDPFDSQKPKKIFKGDIDCSQLLNELRIRSLSTFDPHNMLLWAHYGDGHKGISIEIELNLPLLAKHNIVLNKIIYSDAKMKTGYGDPKRITEDLYLTKQSIWKHEQEYRLITLAPYLTNSHLLISSDKFPFFRIKKIIFGLKTSEDNKTLIKKILPSMAYETISRFSFMQKISSN